MQIPHPTLAWRRDPQSGHWLSHRGLYSLRREAIGFGHIGWCLYQSATRLSVHDTLAQGKATAEARGVSGVQVPNVQLPATTAPAPEALPADPFERTVEVGLRLVGERGFNDIDDALLVARGADPLVLSRRRAEAISAIQQRAHQLQAV